MATDATTDTVTLTWHEAAMASHVGWMRQLAAIKAGKQAASIRHMGDEAGVVNQPPQSRPVTSRVT
jgi:molybdate-binding protein